MKSDSAIKFDLNDFNYRDTYEDELFVLLAIPVKT